MSADQLQTKRNTLTKVISEPCSPPTFFDEEPAPPPLSSQPNDVEPAVETAVVDPPTDAESAGAKQAKSLLSGLGLDTAIRLRWAMRDIRSKRAKLSPVSENDVAALIDLGFVEVLEGIPRLTRSGSLVLD